MRNVGIEFGTLPLACAPGLAPHSRHDPVSILAGRFALKRMIPAPRILLFDSGLGGLTVYREIAKARPATMPAFPMARSSRTGWSRAFLL